MLWPALLALSLAALAAGSISALPAPASAGAPPDSARAAAGPDSLGHPAPSAAPARADSSALPTRRGLQGELLRWKPGAAAVKDTSRAAARFVSPAARPRATSIDAEGARKEGKTDPAELLRARWALLSMPFPTFGPAPGALVLPDGGGPIRLAGESETPGTATDRTQSAVPSVGFLPDLATTLADPAGADAEPLDFTSLERSVEPGRLDGPGDALALPAVRSPSDPLSQSRARLPRRFRTTLLYRKGDGGELTTGVRFLAPELLQGVFGSFAHHEIGRSDVFDAGVSSRYHVAAALPRVLSRAVAVDAKLFQRSVQGPLGGSRAEQERAEVALRAEGVFGRRSEAWSLTLGRTKNTDVLAQEQGRVRWELPSLVAAGEMAWGDSTGSSVYAAGRAGTGRVSYRAGAAPAFEPRRDEARVTAGVRRRIGAGGVGADGAYDWRETERGAWDARVSAWIGAKRATGRLDLESAHQRPSWVDRLEPPETTVVATQTQILTYARSGDPALSPRRLTGAIGFGSWEAAPWLTLTASGSARRVTHDFGWDLERTEGPAFVDVTDAARERGSGWLSHASVAGDLRAGAVAGRVLAWSRFGSSALSPREGEPPRRALEAELGVRLVFFGGDLPVRAGLAAHATGPRQGVVSEPAQVLWDGTLNFDLGGAGVFVEMRNVFDRPVASSLLDLESGRLAPLPGRALHFGVVWNLLD